MLWRPVPPGHQRPWYWWCTINASLYFTSKDFNHLSQIGVMKWYKNSNIFFKIPSFNTVRQGLVTLRIKILKYHETSIATEVAYVRSIMSNKTFLIPDSWFPNLFAHPIPHITDGDTLDKRIVRGNLTEATQFLNNWSLLRNIFIYQAYMRGSEWKYII